MNFLYTQEHVTCHNYEKQNLSLIEVVSIEKGQRKDLKTFQDKLIFVMNGNLCFSFGQYTRKHLIKGEVLMLPAGYNFKSVAWENCSLIIIRITNNFQFCDCFSFEKLLKAQPAEYQHKLTYLPINEALQDYLVQLSSYIHRGILCIHFLELKISELFFILRFFYTKKDLLDFFYLQLTNDVRFSKLVYKNHLKAKNAQELAISLNYSYSGFIKRFKQIFDVPPYRWMKEQKAHRIYHEINTTEKSLAEIGLEYGFSSQGQFSVFCKEQFGASPRDIRKRNRKGKDHENNGKNI